MEKLEWSALEYEERERSKDWFWILGVIVVTSSLASAIFGNYFFAALLLISGALLGFFANKKPDIIYYELNEKGLKIQKELYPYENIKSFWVQLQNPTKEIYKSILFIKTERFFMPVMSIPIHEVDERTIHSILTEKNIDEEEMKEHSSEKIMEFFGF